MKINNDYQIFNLWDTNGRRSDVQDAFRIYLNILLEIQNEQGQLNWNKFPNSLTEFIFYQKAIEKCPDVFKEHPKFDNVINVLNDNEELRKRFFNLDIDWIKDNYPNSNEFLRSIDLGIEDRARHYTSNLVKFGLTDENRNITPVGNSLVNNCINKDVIESILPLDNLNMLYLRQFIKLRIYSNDESSYYSPFYMSLYTLLNYENITEKQLRIIVQGYFQNSENTIDDHINSVISNSFVPNIADVIPEDINVDNKIDFDTFKDYFKNSKSGTVINTYYDFYSALYDYKANSNDTNFNTLISIYKNNEDKINKAFGHGERLFIVGRANQDSSIEFANNNGDSILLNSEISDLNKIIYKEFLISKQIDMISEYSDTTIRIMKATGIYAFKNGLVEIVDSEVMRIIFSYVNILEKIYVSSCSASDEYETYENDIFRKNHSLSNILNYENTEENEIVNSIIDIIPDARSINDVVDLLSERKKNNFINHIITKYPRNVITNLLTQIADRANDNLIKEYVNPDASIPTIYEYIVGIAWYYFSDCDFDLLNSLNLSLNADFDPNVHAPGGGGDIQINYDDRVVMIEVTMMNSSSQKRGEWEPVLRHSINLKAEFENKTVTTYFIANELDYNTINIWKAVSNVRLQATNGTNSFTDGVVIMPLTNGELVSMISNNLRQIDLDRIVHDEFNKQKVILEDTWRDNILNNFN